MGDFSLKIWLFVFLCAVLLGLVFWWMWRTDRKAEREHAEALAALAARAGGMVTGREGARAWTAELREPLASQVGGFLNWLGTVSRPRFTVAVDFRRGPWHVRVTEASMKKATSTSSTTLHEHRIEVATSRLTSLKLCRRVHVGLGGRPLKPSRVRAVESGWVSEMPLTVAREQARWIPVALPDDLGREFIVHTSDIATAPRVLNPQAAAWLLDQTESLGFPYGTFFSVTFESGFVYLTMPRRIDPTVLLPVVDAIIGLLERTPGVTPRHPATTA